MKAFGARLAFCAVALCAALLPHSNALSRTNPFADWGAIVVSGDFHAGGRGKTEAFDNARRDVSSELVRLGFNPANVLQFSARPSRYPGEHPAASDPATIESWLTDLTGRTGAGCLLYFTSHVKFGGLILGDNFLKPTQLAGIVDATCGKRPTIVIVSACYSGIFIEDLAAPNRLIFTASRPDRVSFGCGQDNKYPYFDTCVLTALPSSSDFLELAQSVRACVSGMEARRSEPFPSEPQLSVGAQIAAALPPLR